jgi:RNA polymerase sigma factor (sigma-70 family)
MGLASDQKLLTQWARNRDAEAFKGIVGRYGPMVFATCCRVLGNATAAEDVTQECFELLARTPDAPRTHLGGWLHKVALTRSLNQRKSEVQRKAREEVFGRTRAAQPEPAWNVVYEHVDEAIEELPDELRLPLVAHYLQGQTHAEIAKTLGVNRRTVSYRIARGLEHIGAFLQARGITVSAAALGALFAANLAAAAPLPASLHLALGKLALAHASKTATSAGAAAYTAGTWIGGALVMKKVLIGSVVVIAGALLLYVAVSQPEGPDGTTAAPPVAAVSEAPVEGSVPAAVYDSEPDPTHIVRADALRPEKAEETPSFSGTIEGQVLLPDGRPYAGATVTVAPEDERNGVGSPEAADDAGRFHREDLAFGSYSVQVTPPGRFIFGKGFELERVTLAPDNPSAVLRLVYGTEGDLSIEGTVTTSRGEPIEGVEISCWGPVQRAALTDQAGAFVIEYLPEGDYKIGASKHPFTSGHVMAKAGAGDVEIVLQGNGRIEGIVVDARTSMPLREFEVSAMNGHHRQYSETVFLNVRQVKDPAGRFAIDDMYVGDLTVAARANGYGPDLQHVTLHEGETLSGLVLRLGPAGSLTGRVVDATGQPVAGAVIHLSAIQMLEMLRDPVATTDAEGKFIIDNCPPDLDVLSAYHPDFAPNAAEAIEGVVLVLEKAPHLRVVVYENGVPTAKAKVRVHFMAPIRARYMAGGTTDAEGAADIAHVLPGEVTIEAELMTGRKKNTRALLEPGESHEAVLVFPAAHSEIEGTVDLAPVSDITTAQAILTVETESGPERHETIIDESGLVRFAGVPAGSARLVIDLLVGDRQRLQRLRPFRAEFPVGRSETIQCDLQGAPTGSLNVQAGQAPAGADTVVYLLHGRHDAAEADALVQAHDEWEIAGAASREPDISFPAVPAGDYTLLLYHFTPVTAAALELAAIDYITIAEGETTTASFDRR